MSRTDAAEVNVLRRGKCCSESENVQYKIEERLKEDGYSVCWRNREQVVWTVHSIKAEGKDMGIHWKTMDIRTFDAKPWCAEDFKYLIILSTIFCFISDINICFFSAFQYSVKFYFIILHTKIITRLLMHFVERKLTIFFLQFLNTLRCNLECN